MELGLTTNIQKAVAAASKRHKQGQGTKAHIIETACDLIGAFGYDGVTSSSLIERAGISKGGLYHHFERMDDVIFAAFESTSDRFFGVLGKAGRETFDEYLDEVEHVVFEVLLKDPKSLRIMSELYPKFMFEPSFREARKTNFAKRLKTMSGIVSGRSKLSEEQFEKAFSSVGVFLTGLAVQNREMRTLKQSRELWTWFREALSDKVKRG